MSIKNIVDLSIWFRKSKPIGTTTLLLGMLLTSWCDRVSAQSTIVPDNTLGSESSQVRTERNIEGLPSELIEGGAQRDNNLFHSFSQFNVEAGRGAYFANPEGITNILGRVTGDNVSEILGTLGVLGNADLFLINPNGIVFGENASLDVNGSFVGTTADSVVFDNGFGFSATDPEAPPLLTIDIPIGLQSGSNPGNIVNNSTANGFGLRVPSGENISLIGGDVNLDRGLITTPGGTVELGGLSAAGAIAIDEDSSFSFSAEAPRANVSLTNGAEVNVRAGGGGFINVNARNLLLSGRSRLFAGIAEGMGTTDAQAGDITIDATDSVRLIGVDNSPVGLDTEINNHVGEEVARRDNPDVNSNAFGNGGEIAISTEFLEIGNQARITANSFAIGDAGDIKIDTNSISSGGAIASLVEQGTGNAGNVTINNTNTIAIGDNSNIQSQVIDGGKGNAGNIEIDTGSLTLQEFSVILADNQGTGNAGNITINAEDSISLDGQVSLILSQVQDDVVGDAGDISISSPLVTLSDFSLISTNVNESSIGRTGNIFLNVGTLRLTDGAVIDALTENNFDGGNINVKANLVELSNGGKIVTSGSGGGNAGSLNFDIADTLRIDNSSPPEDSPFDEPILQQLALETGLFANTVGDAIGNGGSIDASAGTIQLENGGSISAATSSSLGGNIALQVEDTLSLRSDSLISAEAGDEGSGGNINIDTGFLVAFPPEGSNGSDIIANAFQGQGGRIDIATQGIFGIESRENLTPFNDITASSEFGLSGVVEIDTPEVDLSQDSLNISIKPVEVEVAQTCQPNTSGVRSEFAVVGRGGLSDSPTNTLDTAAGWEDWGADRPRSNEAVTPDSSLTTLSTNDNRSAQIIEAQGWIVNEEGNVMLVAEPTTSASSPDFLSRSPDCPFGQRNSDR